MIRRRIDPELAKQAAQVARNKADDLQSQSQFASPLLPELTWDTVQVGALLGKGGFNNVNEVVLTSAFVPDQPQEQKYAIKSLRNFIMSRQETFDAGAKDLVVECNMLSRLQHENIVRIHATGILKSAYVDGMPYFLILDRLYGTLEEQIRKWRWQDEHVVKQQSGVVKKLRGNLSDAQKLRLYQRLDTVVVPVAYAMEYIHSRRVLFRDLKPGNVGLTHGGSVKLFDFGLARELNPRSDDDDKLLTANTGSPLYMAPEVALGGRYGLPADVFSFAVFLWEIAKMEIPYDGLTALEHYEQAIEGNFRPKVDARCGSTLIQKLLQQAWDRQPESRPTFSNISEQLHLEVSKKREKFDKPSDNSKSTRTKRSRSGRPTQHPSGPDVVVSAAS